MRLGQDGRNLSEWIRPWFCGLGSGVMDISITFPINKVMFRQQLNGITSKQAINQLKGNRKLVPFLRLVQIQTIVLLKSMSERVGSDVERL